ncbi:MFS transporter [Paraburkholderia rhizosphaerae]|uniref:Sugar phosphate permease n=1 Tax=Paraburkholderia rhizosphaerae TaxID=480658 RepID=A0A4R8LEE2_9BURK|nr:MFS transporter [Paraburkholderia rhizosphaerae]TDY40490.1 sugar phosphate permease [Paraburkholderia rhizosphaerae]
MASNTTIPAKDLAKQRWLIILPAVFVMYMISFFDRVNVGMALPYIAKEFTLNPVQAGWIGGAFAWGYIVTQMLAGYLALRLGPRRLIGICLILFGSLSMLTGLARNFQELLAIRFVLGLTEGPIYAASSMLLAQWFIKSERGRAFGISNLSVAAGGFLAGPISAAVLAHHDWRVMMIVEGLPAWIFCAVWFYAIPQRLDAARWLSTEDRETIEYHIAEEQAAHKDKNVDSWLTIFIEPFVWVLVLGFACSQVILYGLTLWLPTIFKATDQISGMMIGVLSGAPFIMSMLGIYYITNRSDKHNQERRWHAAIPMIVSGVLLIVLALTATHLLYLQIALILAIGFLLKMPTPLISSYLTEILPLRKAVPAVGVVIGGGSFLGQLLGPLLVGYTKSMSTSFGPSFIALGVAGICGGAVLLAARRGGNSEPTFPSTGLAEEP